MDVLLIIAGSILMLAGIAGCILPVLPGPPLSYLGLLAIQISSHHPFSTKFLVIYALIAVIVTVLDYFVPVWGTEKFGGTKKGVWGSGIGLLLGLFFFPPFGIIIGPFLGAVVGELIAGKAMNNALRAGFGSFIGFLAGMVMKLGVSLLMGFHFVKALV